MPKAYPKEFRDDVVAVARQRPKGTTLKQVVDDFGISDSCLANWLAGCLHMRHRAVFPIRPTPLSQRLKDVPTKSLQFFDPGRFPESSQSRSRH
jgi:hypothetical protein